MVHVREQWNSEMTQDQAVRDIKQTTEADDFWIYLA